jgi:hypothetical protein
MRQAPPEATLRDGIEELIHPAPPHRSPWPMSC